MSRRPNDELPRGISIELERTARDKVDAAKRLMAKALRHLEADERTPARATLQKVRELAPRSRTVREKLGRLHYEAGRWHEAAQELLAYRRFSGDHRHDPTIAECYRKLDRPQRSIDFLKDVPLDAVPEQVRIETEVAKARAYVDLGKRSVATASLERAMRDTTSTRARAVYNRELAAVKGS